jgi:hypothetical protein
MEALAALVPLTVYVSVCLPVCFSTLRRRQNALDRQITTDSKQTITKIIFRNRLSVCLSLGAKLPRRRTLHAYKRHATRAEAAATRSSIYLSVRCSRRLLRPSCHCATRSAILSTSQVPVPAVVSCFLCRPYPCTIPNLLGPTPCHVIMSHVASHGGLSVSVRVSLPAADSDSQRRQHRTELTGYVLSFCDCRSDASILAHRVPIP